MYHVISPNVCVEQLFKFVLEFHQLLIFRKKFKKINK